MLNYYFFFQAYGGDGIIQRVKRIGFDARSIYHYGKSVDKVFELELKSVKRSVKLYFLTTAILKGCQTFSASPSG